MLRVTWQGHQVWRWMMMNTSHSLKTTLILSRSDPLKSNKMNLHKNFSRNLNRNLNRNLRPRSYSSHSKTRHLGMMTIKQPIPRHLNNQRKQWKYETPLTIES